MNSRKFDARRIRKTRTEISRGYTYITRNKLWLVVAAARTLPGGTFYSAGIWRMTKKRGCRRHTEASLNGGKLDYYGRPLPAYVTAITENMVQIAQEEEVKTND